MYEAKKGQGAGVDQVGPSSTTSISRRTGCTPEPEELQPEPVWYCTGGPPGKSWQGGSMGPTRPEPGPERGFTLTELLIALCIMGLLVALSAPAVTKIHRRIALATLSRELSCQMMGARARAIMQRQAIALVFEQDAGKWRCFMAEDGDGDGVRRDDLKRGRDRKLSEVYGLTGRVATLGFLQLPSIPNPSGRGRITGNMNDPVRAGRGDIITFTQEGTATPCSVYFTDNHSYMRVIRVYGGTGKIHLYEWHVDWPAWRRPKH